MTYKINLDEVDIDGAIREAATRRQAIPAWFPQEGRYRRRSLISGGAMLSALAPSAFARERRPSAASFGKGDVGILNSALTLEYLEAAFYNGATAANLSLSSPGAAFLKIVTPRRERARHVPEEGPRLKAVKEPKFDFKGTNTNAAMFMATAQVLENTGVHAYSGQALNIKSPAYVKAAVSILTIEARHASVIGLLNESTGGGIAPDGPFDTPLPARKVLAAVKGTGFIVG